VSRMFRIFTVAVVLCASTAALVAQEAPPQAAARNAPAALVPLKVTLVFSRFQGEKKLSSVPYVLFLTANDRRETNLRMGTRVPVVSTVFGGGAANVQSSFTYQNVGTDIDCSASSAPEGGFTLQLTVTDSSLYYPEKRETAPASVIDGVPAMRNFTSKFNVLLRDGQTAQYVAATDPVSGQTVRIDATLNVQK
jgi:hypothetical protein